MATLKEVNDSLEHQSETLEHIDNDMHDVKYGILGIFGLQQASRLDDLEARREARKDAAPQATTIQQATTQSGSGQGIDLMSALGFKEGMDIFSGIGKLFSMAMLARLFKRGLIGGLAVLFADEIGAGVTALTGSDIAGAMTEAGLVGGGIGYSLFGPKGAILGAIATATVVAGDKLKDYIEKEMDAKNVEWGPLLGQSAQALTNIAGFATAGGAIAGPWGAIAGAVIGGGVSLYQAIDRYKTDPKFQQLVDDTANNVLSTIEGGLKSASDIILKSLDVIADPLVTTSEEETAWAQANPEKAKRLKEIQPELNALAKKAYEAGGIQNLSNEDKLKLKSLSDEKQKLLNSQKAFDRKSNADLGIPDLMDESSTGPSNEDMSNAIETTKQKTSEMIKSTADRIAAANEIRASGRQVVPTFVRDMSERGQEAYVSQAIGPSEMSRIKTLAREMNMTLIDYFERYGIGQASSTVVAPVDQSQTNIGSSSTTLIGGGTSTFDSNSPAARKAVEQAVVL